MGGGVFSTRKHGTSSGADMASHAVHYIIRERILDKELGIHRDGPIKSNTDNLAALLKGYRRAVEQQRLSVRRHAEKKVVLLLKMATDESSPAGIITDTTRMT